MNVMFCTGFGQQAAWTDDFNSMPDDHKMSPVDSIYGVITYLSHLLLLPKWLLGRSPWKKPHQSYVEFDQYMQEFLAAEKLSLQKILIMRVK